MSNESARVRRGSVGFGERRGERGQRKGFVGGRGGNEDRSLGGESVRWQPRLLVLGWVPRAYNEGRGITAERTHAAAKKAEGKGEEREGKVRSRRGKHYAL